jgi:hypothetical protein
MDLARVADLNIRFQHRHSDGTLGTFEPEPDPHSPHDPEHDWASGTIYRCTTCDEEIIVEQDEPSTVRP